MNLRLALLLPLSLLAQPPLRLTGIQVIGTHNSYHIGLAPNELALLRKNNPPVAAALEYRLPALEAQLQSGVRQFEIDIYSDVRGGRFAEPKLPQLVAAAGLPADPPFDPAGLMKKPGFKVVHAKDYDFRSHCQPFVHCLSIIQKWSKSNPTHLPIFILVENKDRTPAPDAPADPDLLTAATFDALDAEIRSVFPANQLLTPDQVRGAHETLEKAVLTDGWPTLAAARGKVVFLLDQERATPLYAAGHPSLRGRILFTNSLPGTPETAFVKMNNPQDGRIPHLVRQGYLVRTMCDARSGETVRRDAALRSGAQMLSTNYPFEHKDPKSPFAVKFEAGVIARCNPILQSPACNAAVLTEK